MKTSKLKIIPLSICCLIAALWSEVQCADSSKEEKKIIGQLIRNQQIESSPLVVITFSVSKKTQGMEDSLKYSDQNPNTFQVWEKTEIFAMREAMIDECINQYKALSSIALSYGQLCKVCSILNPKYDNRVDFNKYNKVYDDNCGNIYEVWLMTDEGRDWLSTKVPEHFLDDEMMGLAFKYYYKAAAYQDALKVDVIKSMEIYETLYGKTHPRKDEFNKMGSLSCFCNLL